MQQQTLSRSSRSIGSFKGYSREGARLDGQWHTLMRTESMLVGAFDTLMQARAIALQWVASKYGVEADDLIASRGSFQLHGDDAGLSIADDIELEGRWSFVLEQPDPSLPTRRWRTSACLEVCGQHTVLRAHNETSATDGGVVNGTVPRFVRNITAALPALDGDVPLDTAVRYVEDEAGFDKFLDVLLSQQRKLPVVVVSSLKVSGAYPVNPERLGNALRGNAHVFALAEDTTFWLSDEVGDDLAVYNGACRVYEPGFSAKSDPRQHRLIALPQDVRDGHAVPHTALLVRLRALAVAAARTGLPAPVQAQ